MTDDEIIARAKSLGWNIEHAQTNRMLILFARDIEDQVRYQEREACAKVCEDMSGPIEIFNPKHVHYIDCAAAIRARGEQA